MANIIDYDLYLQGPAALVEQITAGPLPRCYDSTTLKIATLSKYDGITIFKMMNDSPSDPPYEWLRELVAKYHDHGVRFFLSFIDSDNWSDPRIEPCVNYRFGEMYTAPIESFGAGPRVHSCFTSETGVWQQDGPITVISNRTSGLDGVTEVWVRGKCIKRDDIDFDHYEESNRMSERDAALVREEYAKRRGKT
jgi:hypothetical protein